MDNKSDGSSEIISEAYLILQKSNLSLSYLQLNNQNGQTDGWKFGIIE